MGFLNSYERSTKIRNAVSRYLHQHRCLQKTLSLLLALCLLGGAGFLSLVAQGYEAVAMVRTFSQVHPGEETAAYLGPDTFAYTTVNLRPGLGQLEKMSDVLGKWNKHPIIGSLMDEMLEYLEQQEEISLEEDILPWLGPEIAVGIADVPEPPYYEPDGVAFIGTTDRAASDDVLLNKILPFMMPGVTPVWDTYRGMDFIEIEELFLALTDEYYIVSSSLEQLEAVLDLYLDGGDSLATTPGFQESQDNLPSERMVMGYVDCEFVSMYYGLEGFTSSFIGYSIVFVDDGIGFDLYTPIPEEMESPPVLGPNPLNSAQLVPGDALAFLSTYDVYGGYQWLKPIIAENWEWIVYMLGIDGPDCPDSLEDALDMISEFFGFDLEADVLSWMDGEVAFAIMPHPESNPGSLGLFEVADPVDVNEKMQKVLDGLIDAGAPLTVRPESYRGIDVTWVDYDLDTYGYASLDADSATFLVAGTENALTLAIDTFVDTEPSLSDNSEFQWQVDSLPADKAHMAYVDIQGGVDFVRALAGPPPEGVMPATPEWVAFVSPIRSVGMSGGSVSSTGVSVTTIIHVESPFHIDPATGQILETMAFTTMDRRLNVTIPEGTMALDELGNALSTMRFRPLYPGSSFAVPSGDANLMSTPPPPEGAHIVWPVYRMGPSGATFNPPLMLTWRYDLWAIPEDFTEDDLSLAYYDDVAEQWVEVPSVVNSQDQTIAADVAHFTTFAVIVGLPEADPDPDPAPDPDPDPDPDPGSGCFIATAAYGTPMAAEIQVMRDFRDGYLLTNRPGQAFADFYYKTSPPIAEFITEHPGIKPVVRTALVPAVAMSAVVVNTCPAQKAAMLGVLLLAVVVAAWAIRRRGSRVQYD